jgi:predicted nucleic-acid-binding Zn-ribbon protein
MEAVTMTHNIIAIDELDLKCPECGNTNPEKFRIITSAFAAGGFQIPGCTLSGVTCMVCKYSMGLDHVANSTWR